MKLIINLFLVACSLCFQPAHAQGNGILTTIKNTPDLSTFYSLIASDGPGFGQRFNNPSDGKKYTVLAPTNDAFSKVHPDTLAVLKSPKVQPLLNSLLLDHVLPGDLQDSELKSTTIEAEGGFTFTFDNQGGMTTNQDSKSSETTIGTQARFVRGTNGGFTRIPAANGAVYKIDRFVDTYLTYLGEQGPCNLPAIERRRGDMASLIRNDADFSKLRAQLDKSSPDFLNQLGKGSYGEQSTVYLAPNDAAFEALPDEAKGKSQEDRNQDLVAFLLEAGYGQLVTDGSSVRAENGLSIAVREGRANNAQIKRRVCVDDGCVWAVGRWIDPVYGVFDGRS